MTHDEKRAKRIHDITYSTDDRAELAERMVGLEELVRDMYKSLLALCGWRYTNGTYLERMHELEVKVDDEQN